MAKSKSNGLSYEDAERSIRQKKFSPVYLFYGEEDFLIQEMLDLIIDKAVDSSTQSFNLDILHGSDVDARDVVSLASAFPMMAEYRVVVVKEFDRLTNKDNLIPFIENALPSTVLVLILEKPDFRVKINKSIEKYATLVEFKRMYDNKIPGWIENQIAKLGKSASPDSCQLIQSHVGNSIREIRNEIDKLFIFIGDKKSIDVDDVNAVVGMSKQYNIFELQKAVGRKDIATAQVILERMLEAGESPVSMIVMLTKYFQKLYIIWDLLENRITKDELIKTLRLSTRQLPHLDNDIAIARGFSSGALTRCFAALIDTDEKLKSSSQDEKLILTLMLYNMIRAA
jgi:DNA polymerase-3 subunit delta